MFQEQALILNVPVDENLVLSQEHRFTRFGQLIDRTAMIKVAEQIIADAGLDVDVRRDAGTYDFSKRQAIEIARACMAPRHLMGIADPLVLLDEPTSALDRQDEAGSSSCWLACESMPRSCSFPTVLPKFARSATVST